jgi:hypothetical protein
MVLLAGCARASTGSGAGWHCPQLRRRGTNCIERWPLCRGEATEGCSAVRHWQRCGNDAGARALVSCSRSRFMRGGLRPLPRLLGFQIFCYSLHYLRL